jgi:hypothetical protein
MDNKSYQQLTTIIEELASKIDTPQNLLPTYKISDDGALPHIVIDESGLYHFIIVERGQEIEHRHTADLDELLYWVFAGITFSMACKHESRHRVRNQDFRKLLFQHQEQLLDLLSPQWKEKEVNEHARILEGAPFDDTLN